MFIQSHRIVSYLLIIPLLLAVLIFSLLAFLNFQTTGHLLKSHAAYAVKNVPILSIGYFPPELTSKDYLDIKQTGADHTYTISEWESFAAQKASQLAFLIGEGTRYKGYNNNQALQYLNYYILTTRNYSESEPVSPIHSQDQFALTGRYPDYHAILLANNVCSYVDDQGVKEIWIFSFHHEGIYPVESITSSKYGNISNSKDLGEFNPPRCKHSYTMYNFDTQKNNQKDRAIGDLLSSRMRQMENILSYADYADNISHWPSEADSPLRHTPYQLFFGNFADYNPVSSLNRSQSLFSACGNSHFAPNWESFADQNNYEKILPQLSNCENWNPDAKHQIYSKISCENWNCAHNGRADINYHIYFMQNLPGYKNNLHYLGKNISNWWGLIYDFDKYIDTNGRSLLTTSAG